MNNINFSRARNGTRIALNKNHLILLVALAFLSLAIVFLCVSYNLNALATDNIAFADGDELRVDEEPTRAISSTGYIEPNLIDYNWGSFWSYRSSVSNSQVTLDTSTRFRYVLFGNGSISNNVISCSSGYIDIRFYPLFGLGSLNACLAVSVSNITGGTVTYGYYGTSENSYAYSSPYSYRGGQNRSWGTTNYIYIRLTGTGSFTFDWINFAATGNFFYGYVSPDYQNYGYNQGYLEGFEDGQENAPVPDFTNDTGLVGSNILKYNYWLDADFDFVSAGTTTIWEQDDQSIQLVNGTLHDNVLTASVSERQQQDRSGNRSSTMLKYNVPNRNGGAEVFAVYVSALTGSWELGLMNSERSVILSVGLNVLYIPATQSERAPSETYNIFTLNDNDSITISWCKLESGTSFTGYVAPDNANSYESGYEQGLIDGYYNGITDLNSIKTVLNNVPMETRTPYYAINVTESPYGVNNTYMDITYHIASAVSGVTYGNYIPVIFNLAYNVPVGLDLFWKFDGAILNPHSSEIDPNGSSTIYYGFYDSVSFVGYGPEFAPYQDTISWPSNSSSNYEVVFHARYSGNYLVLWFYTDNENPYYEFGIRTPMVDGSYNSNPFYFEYNPYTITDSSVNLDNAKQQGYQEGFNSGYNQGKFENSVSGQYTFKNLIGSVFDAPISALLGTYDEREGARVGGLLNFEVLGVNLGGFVIGLLSLAIILFVLRVFMRGL